MKNIALVLLSAAVFAFMCERYVVSLGATKLAAAGSAGGAFLGVGTLGLMALDYLAPAVSS
ncbi:hypothetical protein OG369_39430 [Streptomyces sp. NBC_01221]|uniref:hypothetical protein n=1 Tax=Streptomyces sp. NBC_01221 TaxID=2903782 RepID=UPI0022594500|nr:hypothetical protein [Streptomyces sp. NBC_01221]MCX4791931.1 hypothetical protein [Streptomyces sp. NBC_01221]